MREAASSSGSPAEAIRKVRDVRRASTNPPRAPRVARWRLHASAGSACAQPSEAPPAATDDSKSAPSDLDFVSALQAAEAIRNKRVSSVELTQRTFERIDRLNPQLNAFTYQLREEALAQARRRTTLNPAANRSGFSRRSGSREGELRGGGLPVHVGYRRAA